MKAAKKRSKYGNVPTMVDGVRFASKAEAARYGELRLLQKAEVITGLECQPRFPFVVNGRKVCVYVGDFQYLENGDRCGGERLIVEDVKSKPTETAAFKIKAKLMAVLYPHIELRIVRP